SADEFKAPSPDLRRDAQTLRGATTAFAPVERFAGELNFLAQSQNLRACLRDQFDRADQPCAMLGIHRPLHGPGLCGRYWRRVDQHGASAPSRHADFSTISSIRKGQSAAAASGRLMLSSDLRSAATP